MALIAQRVRHNASIPLNWKFNASHIHNYNFVCAIQLLWRVYYIISAVLRSISKRTSERVHEECFFRCGFLYVSFSLFFTFSHSFTSHRYYSRLAYGIEMKNRFITKWLCHFTRIQRALRMQNYHYAKLMVLYALIRWSSFMNVANFFRSVFLLHRFQNRLKETKIDWKIETKDAPSEIERFQSKRKIRIVPSNQFCWDKWEKHWILWHFSNCWMGSLSAHFSTHNFFSNCFLFTKHVTHEDRREYVGA